MKKAALRILSCLPLLTITPAMAGEYQSLKTAVLEAIDAANGQARGTLVGLAAEKITATTKSSAPIHVEITT